jgi:hypothetical protein
MWTIYGVFKKYFHATENFVHLTGICNIAISRVIETPYEVTAINYTVYILFNAGPCAYLIAANLALIVVAARKSNTSVNKANVLIVVVTTGTFLVSVLPRFITYVVPRYLGRLYGDFAWYILFSISWVNPAIYLATNKNFRDFTLGRLRSISSSFKSTMS